MLSSGGAYTDLIYASGSLIAEVGGTQNAVPTYRITDNLGSLGSVNYSPYGQIFSGSTSDPFGFTGLQSDPTTALYHATFRQYSIQQGRWQSPDPYAGSYNWADPQSLNRYAYVNGRAMAFTDPSGKDACAVAGAVGPEVGAFALIPLAGCIAELLGGGALMDALFGDIFGTKFHGSLKPRPNRGPMSETLGMPTGWQPNGNLASGIQGALGLPSGGCEFGVCGGIPGESFGPGLVLAGGGSLLCQIAEPCGVIEDTVLVIGTLATVGTVAWEMSKGGKQNVGHDWVRAMARSLGGDYCSALKAIMQKARRDNDGVLFNAAKQTYKQDCRGYGN